MQPPPAEGAGSSALVVDSDQSGAVGTYLYTAPEAARGLPVSSKVDLCAFPRYGYCGCCLHALTRALSIPLLAVVI